MYGATAPRQDFLLRDDFDEPELSQWTITNGGSWEISGAEMRQTSNATGAKLVAGSPTWTDYRVTTLIKSSPGEDNGAIGLVFRYQDENNYYRFEMDAANNRRRVTRVLGGTQDVIWSSAVGYQVGRDYAVVVECFADQIRVHLDGVEIAAIEDASLTQGRVGFYTSGHDTARFAFVRVSASDWRTHYEFEGEPTKLFDGTRVRILSGNSDSAPTAETGVVYRFAAATGDAGTVHLRAGIVAVRLLSPDGAVLDQRKFVPSSRATVLSNPRILRNADSTSFFLFPPASSSFDRATYTLQFTYRRNAGADLPIYTQAGDDGDEVVAIDVPWPLAGA